MKKFKLSLIIFIAIFLNTQGQESMSNSNSMQNESFRQLLISDMDSLLIERFRYEDSINSVVSSYGMQVGQFKTMDGFSSSTEVTLFLKCQKKLIEAGVFFDNDKRNLTGISLTYKYFILRKIFNENSVIEPYINYNFLYRVTYLDKPLSMYPESAGMIDNDRSRYASMEHYLGTGAEINVFKYCYINVSAGFGRYLGSIKKPVNPNPATGLYEGGNGWGGIVKISIGFRLP